MKSGDCKRAATTLSVNKISVYTTVNRVQGCGGHLFFLPAVLDFAS